ncbi:capsid cement protein [Mycobacterium sp. NPDC049093]
MAEFVPIFKPGQSWTSTTSADVTAGQALVVTGQDTVAASSAANPSFVGIAAFDAKSGEKVTVLSGGGVYELTSTGTVNDGDALTTAASGAVTALGAGTTYSQVIGVALADAASNKVKALLFR